MASPWNSGGCKCCGPACSSLCVRVQDNCSPPVPISGASVSLSKDGTPVGSCTTSSQVSGVTITNGGSGYDPDSPPTVGFSGGGGSGAAATANMGGGVIQTSIPVTAGGSGYRFPQVSFDGGSKASGAAATASGTVSGHRLVMGGSGYTDGAYTDGTFSGGGGSGGSFSYTVVGGAVTSITITSGGSNFTMAPALSPGPSAGPGAGFYAIGTLTITSITRTAAGTLYVSPTVTISDSFVGASGATATCTASTIVVGGVTMTSGGSGYTSNPTVSFSAASGSGAAGTATRAVQCCFGDLPKGTYTISASATGFNSGTATVTIPPCNPVTVTLTHATTIARVINLNGCGFHPIEGATITASPGGTCTTDATGFCSISVPASTPVTISGHHERFQDWTFTASDNGCGAVNACPPGGLCNMTPNSDYPRCVPDGTPFGTCALPLTKTPVLTDPFYGPCVLTYDSSLGLWIGTNTVTFPGCGSCPSVGMTLSYQFNGTGISVGFNVWNSSGTLCPGDGTPFVGTSGCTLNPSSTSITCPPAYLFTLTTNNSRNPGCFTGPGSTPIYCAGSPLTPYTFTVTE